MLSLLTTSQHNKTVKILQSQQWGELNFYDRNIYPARLARPRSVLGFLLKRCTEPRVLARDGGSLRCGAVRLWTNETRRGFAVDFLVRISWCRIAARARNVCTKRKKSFAIEFCSCRVESGSPGNSWIVSTSIPVRSFFTVRI